MSLGFSLLGEDGSSACAPAFVFASAIPETLSSSISSQTRASAAEGLGEARSVSTSVDTEENDSRVGRDEDGGNEERNGYGVGGDDEGPALASSPMTRKDTCLFFRDIAGRGENIPHPVFAEMRTRPAYVSACLRSRLTKMIGLRGTGVGSCAGVDAGCSGGVKGSGHVDAFAERGVDGGAERCLRLNRKMRKNMSLDAVIRG